TPTTTPVPDNRSTTSATRPGRCGLSKHPDGQQPQSHIGSDHRGHQAHEEDTLSELREQRALHLVLLPFPSRVPARACRPSRPPRRTARTGPTPRSPRSPVVPIRPPPPPPAPGRPGCGGEVGSPVAPARPAPRARLFG